MRIENLAIACVTCGSMSHVAISPPEVIRMGGCKVNFPGALYTDSFDGAHYHPTKGPDQWRLDDICALAPEVTLHYPIDELTDNGTLEFRGLTFACDVSFT